MDKIVLISLGVWAFITGLLLVTNIQVVWSGPIMGIAALVCGVVCLIRAFANKQAT